MNTAVDMMHHSPDNAELHDLIQAACQCIAPSWPLDQLIAVNPYWGRINLSFEDVHATLTQLAGSQMFMPRDYYREAWQSKQITRADIASAIEEFDNTLTPEEVVAELVHDDQTHKPRSLLSDHVDMGRDLLHEPSWDSAIKHQISQFCAAFFDRDQAEWHPVHEHDLYSSWLEAIRHDYGVVLLMHASNILDRARHLPGDPVETIAFIIEKLEISPADTGIFLQTILLRINGWASWCAYLRWQAQLNEHDDQSIVNLLAIRLAWEYLLDDDIRSVDSTWATWKEHWQSFSTPTVSSDDQKMLVWQRAHEVAYQCKLTSLLASESGADTDTPEPKVQAVFCIDVRSEVFRRALEKQSPAIKTFGFAGFFGLPICYTPIGTAAKRPQLPGLLSAAIEVSECSHDQEFDNTIAAKRQQYHAIIDSWQPFSKLPASAFALVESLGLGYLGKLIHRSVKNSSEAKDPYHQGLSDQSRQSLTPQLKLQGENTLRQKVAIAVQVLNAMSLTRDFARLVLLVGHGSQSSNNPHAAGLDCGACCGQTGEVNARALAKLLNDKEVRQELVNESIIIPETTCFVPALHNTTTDEVHLFDIHGVPDVLKQDIQSLRSQLGKATKIANAERARHLAMASTGNQSARLLSVLKTRANDWSQTRPEWGLANNAAFIVAPRERTRELQLEGRTFLHNYDWTSDPGYKVLELIMTAPMIVTHWINMQYYASTVDNRLYGSGNKVLHNVVGGRIGIFEGNGGDLRIGLAKQSLHDGNRWMHTPLRLSVYIEAPRAAIDKIIEKHENVFQLIHNRWIHLFNIEGKRISQFRHGQWHLVSA